MSHVMADISQGESPLALEVNGIIIRFLVKTSHVSFLKQHNTLHFIVPHVPSVSVFIWVDVHVRRSLTGFLHAQILLTVGRSIACTFCISRNGKHYEFLGKFVDMRQNLQNIVGSSTHSCLSDCAEALGDFWHQATSFIFEVNGVSSSRAPSCFLALPGN